MVCLFSSTFVTEISFPLSIVHQSDLAIFSFIVGRVCFQLARSRAAAMSSVPPALAEELYLVFIACIERLLCRAAKYSSGRVFWRVMRRSGVDALRRTLLAFGRVDPGSDGAARSNTTMGGCTVIIIILSIIIFIFYHYFILSLFCDYDYNTG